MRGNLDGVECYLHAAASQEHEIMVSVYHTTLVVVNVLQPLEQTCHINVHVHVHVHVYLYMYSGTPHSGHP